ncbi:D-2-hydroxyacid dehydrogenase [Tractidigestivibacter scatoligenes]|jgi:phosphoglycerate dehydrogenase-like enzyme|uniref:D-2-hydroxyacid dehydrogenase n=1 Tax=Tractidigestivibacter scatoligenes TaxID=1299998 RepID=UPI002F357CF5
MPSVENVLVKIPVTEEQAAAMMATMSSATFDFAASVGDTSHLPRTPKLDLSPERVDQADVILGNVEPALIEASPRLQWIQLGSAGYEAYLAPGVLDPSTIVTNGSGAYGPAVAEHSFAMLLSLMKRLPAYRDDQRGHVWTDEGMASSLAGARVLVLGAGDIGLCFARLCTAVGATCVGVRRHVPSSTSPEHARAFERVVAMDELTQELPKADVVASFLPSSDQTRGLVGAEFLGSMKPGAYLVNAGRGDLIDQAALLAALEEGRIAGAALDVTTPEPLPQDDPLWDAPNLIITPHVAGFWHLHSTLERVVALATDNLGRFARGEGLRNLVRG